MPSPIQDILVLFHDNASLDSSVLAWSRYFASAPEAALSDEEEPPYPTALAAMRDGWRVLQMPVLRDLPTGAAYEVGHFRYQTVLERFVEPEGTS